MKAKIFKALLTPIFGMSTVGMVTATSTSCSNEHSSSDTVTVKGVTLNKFDLRLYVGTTEQLTATVEPENASNKKVIWSSDDPSVATVDENGNVTAISGGFGSITVTTEDGGHKAVCNFTIYNIPISSASLNPSVFEMPEGATKKLDVVCLPKGACVKSITWSSSNKRVASVNIDGVVTANNIGTATISAKIVDYFDNKFEATSNFKITAGVLVEGVELNKNGLTLAISDTERLDATIYPENATNKDVSWTSSNPDVATVDENGLVTAVSEGNTTITVTTRDGGYQATCEVNVFSSVVPAEIITLEKHNLEMFLNADHVYPDNVDVTTYQLKATVEPENASNKKVIWSSDDPSVATVDENGNVTAISEGETRIIACLEDNQYRVDSCNVKVTNFKILESDIEIPIGESRVLHIDSKNNLSSVNWQCYGKRIATVENDGTVTAVGEGTTRVTAQLNILDSGVTIYAYCDVRIVSVQVQYITLEPYVLQLYAGESGKFTVVFTPNNATNKNVTWTSSNPDVATVDENGVVTAISNGRSTITATTEDGEKTDQALVVVSNR